MSIASEISRLQTAKANLKTSIEGKGVTVPSATTLDGYPALVDAISGGGGGDPVLDYQNPLGTWFSELPDLSKLDRTTQVLYIVVDTSRCETPLYESVGFRPQQAGTVNIGHMSNGAFVVDSTESITASQYWSKTLNKNGERFWILKFTSESNIERIDSNAINQYYTPIVAYYGYLPYCSQFGFTANNENTLLIDLKGIQGFPNGSSKAFAIKYTGTFAIPVNAFYNNPRIYEIDLSGCDIDASTTFAGAFRSDPYLHKIKFGTTNNTGNVTTIQNMFAGDTCLNHLDISGLDLTGVTTTTGLIDNCTNLTDIDGWTAIKVSYSLVSTSGAHYLTHDSLMKVINSLPTVQTSQTLTIGSSNLGRLSAEEIAVATAKGWSVA